MPALQAERQLLAIEAAMTPHMKPDDARAVTRRHVARMRPPEQRKPKGMAVELLDAFRSAGFKVEQTPKGRDKR